MSETLTVAALYAERKARRDAELDQLHQAEAAALKEQDAEHRAFLARAMTEADAADIQHRILRAFGRHEREVQILAFPSDYCPDSGRRINHALPGWEDQLPGFAKALYAYWSQTLKPGGFGLQARIVSLRDGMPGDVGLFVTWPDEFSFDNGGV
ncbi:hypothetical protein BKE38_23740 [Pseudoroseomonas deserti]|uniref:Uncharacterized protein n=1 Tax=Teichococcus deserti TaxID=1817963 RepID=A0A1V2GYJ8_9PROT|nr:hypothetical protein [Pseudoroseomonas deserti]ONG47367.1 hypothetical protein BKE38_23740 [Pseudoroseomonas deserti]